MNLPYPELRYPTWPRVAQDGPERPGEARKGLERPRGAILARGARQEGPIGDHRGPELPGKAQSGTRVQKRGPVWLLEHQSGPDRPSVD